MNSARVIPLVPAERPQGGRDDGPSEALIRAVLHEVARGLQALAHDAGQVDIIDLRSLPLDAATSRALRERLGMGEVFVRVRSAACTEIAETAYAGVWWQRQGAAGADGRVADDGALETILIARSPPLVAAHEADVAEAGERLRIDLRNSDPIPTGAPVHA